MKKNDVLMVRWKLICCFVLLSCGDTFPVKQVNEAMELLSLNKEVCGEIVDDIPHIAIN